MCRTVWLPRPNSSVVSVYTGRTLAVYTRGPVYRVSVCQCVISVPQCILPVYVQYTLNTLEFDLGIWQEELRCKSYTSQYIVVGQQEGVSRHNILHSDIFFLKHTGVNLFNEHFSFSLVNRQG